MRLEVNHEILSKPITLCSAQHALPIYICSLFPHQLKTSRKKQSKPLQVLNHHINSGIFRALLLYVLSFSYVYKHQFYFPAESLSLVFILAK